MSINTPIHTHDYRLTPTPVPCSPAPAISHHRSGTHIEFRQSVGIHPHLHRVLTHLPLLPAPATQLQELLILLSLKRKPLLANKEGPQRCARTHRVQTQCRQTPTLAPCSCASATSPCPSCVASGTPRTSPAQKGCHHWQMRRDHRSVCSVPAVVRLLAWQSTAPGSPVCSETDECRGVRTDYTCSAPAVVTNAWQSTAPGSPVCSECGVQW